MLGFCARRAALANTDLAPATLSQLRSFDQHGNDGQRSLDDLGQFRGLDRNSEGKLQDKE